MIDDKEMILKLFKSGGTIESVTMHIFYQMKEKESLKKKDERSKVDKREVRKIVEETILSDYLVRVR